MEKNVERGMSHMKREQGVNDPIKPEGERKRRGLGGKNGAIHLLEFLGVSSSKGVCNLLFVREELIQGARRDPSLRGNPIRVASS